MYRGFKLPELSFNNENEYYEIGNTLFNALEKLAQESLKYYISTDGVLDGGKMMEDWFPAIEAHVFISHSHNDRDMAITLAGSLKKNFGIISFIDSCIWGFANDLLKIIDQKYCKLQGTNSYSYDLRNFSTSHVHMMLSTALAKMIDKTLRIYSSHYKPNEFKFISIKRMGYNNRVSIVSYLCFKFKCELYLYCHFSNNSILVYRCLLSSTRKKIQWVV